MSAHDLIARETADCEKLLGGERAMAAVTDARIDRMIVWLEKQREMPGFRNQWLFFDLALKDFLEDALRNENGFAKVGTLGDLLASVSVRYVAWFEPNKLAWYDGAFQWLRRKLS